MAKETTHYFLWWCRRVGETVTCLGHVCQIEDVDVDNKKVHLRVLERPNPSFPVGSIRVEHYRYLEAAQGK